MKESKFSNIRLVIVLIIISLICLLPFYVLIVLSLNDSGTLFYDGNMFVPDFYFPNYIEAFNRFKISRAMLNSGIITIGSLVLTIGTAGMAGYSISRLKSKFNKILFPVLIGCMMIPGIINTVPLYTLMRHIN